MGTPGGHDLRIEGKSIEDRICFGKVINGMMMTGFCLFLFAKKVQHGKSIQE